MLHRPGVEGATCGEHNMARSHAYLNIQGLRVAADWAPRHWLGAAKDAEEMAAVLGSLRF